MASTPEYLNVLIVGAGLSGVNASYRVQNNSPYGDSYAVLEARDSMGGTWDYFKYPGLRSDSDMYTLGLPFRPWTDQKMIASGPDILQYIKDTAREFGIDKKVRYGHRVVSSEWNSKDAVWKVNVDVSKPGQEQPTRRVFVTKFLYFCSGYYSYQEGHTAQFPGLDNFKGDVIHPQFWPEDYDYSGKKVVIVGSGATAVTLLPSMTPTAAHVTMLQRSPSYFVVLPSSDAIGWIVRHLFPQMIAHSIERVRMAARSYFFLYFCKLFPALATKVLRFLVSRELPADLPLDPHFKPSYKPWDQRVCLIPDGDFFAALRSGKGSVVTDHIAGFDASGVKLKSGKHLDADVLITATGLKMQLAGGSNLIVDGEKVNFGERFLYKGQMIEDVPNAAICIGYTNASWSLGSDLAGRYFARLISHMHKNGIDTFTPRCDHSITKAKPLLNLNSGYVQRAAGHLPKGGTRGPWYSRVNYFYDWFTTKFGRVDDEIEFTKVKKTN